MKLLFRLFVALFPLFGICSEITGGVNILLPIDAIPAEHTAAVELQKGLKRIFGREFPILRGESPAPAIRIGQSPETARLLGNLDFSTLRPDEIILKTVGGNLILTGERPRGSLYAVFELLEKEYGVRFWTAQAEFWPKRKKFTLPQIDYRYAPVFQSREIFYDFLHQDPVFAVKMRNNGHRPHIADSWGGNVELLGWCHTFEKLIPPATYFAAHPEWFAEHEGKRDPDTQLCLTNKAMRRQLCAAVLEELKKKPKSRIISVSQNDNKSFCTCSACTAFVRKNGNQSDLLIDAVNEVAEAVARDFPGVKVETLAYTYTRQAPESVRPRPNVIVRLCSIECDFSAPLDSQFNAAFADDVRAWGKQASELYIWNYVTNFEKFYLPHPNWKNLAPDLRFFAANGATAVFEQGSAGPRAIADFAELRAWLICKLLWNPAQDVEQLTREFVNGYYGAAAPEILNYLEIMSAALKPGSQLSCYNKSAYWLDDRQLQKLHSIMEAAQAKVAASPELLKRVKEAAVSINLTLLERDTLWPASRSAELLEILEQQLATAKAAGTSKFAEHLPLSGYDVLRNRFLIKHTSPVGKAPEVAGNRPWREVYAVNAFRSGDGRWNFVEKDAAARKGRALRMPNTHKQWASQVRDLPLGNYDVYIEIRCESAQPAGKAAKVGIYNSATRQMTEVEIPAREIAGKTYKTVKIGSAELTPHSSLFCSPVINPAVKNIWIARYILVQKEN